nr:unnamed protein product [Spirometra erinaceieuropaei]
MQKREKSKVVPAILSADILVCAGVFVVIFTWLICLLAFKDVGDYGGFNSAEQAVLFGFSHTVISDYPELEIFIQSWQYACALLVFCLLANMFNLPKKMLLLDILSAILVWCIHGWEFTLTIIIISIAFSVIGAYAGRSPLIMLFVGIVVLAYIREILRVCLPEAFVFRIFAVRVAYPGFYASVVRCGPRAMSWAPKRATSRSSAIFDQAVVATKADQIDPFQSFCITAYLFDSILFGAKRQTSGGFYGRGM